MGLFNRQKKEKETNIAVTPESPKPKKEFSKAKFYYLLWTIVSMAFHCCYVFYLIISVAQQYFLSQAIFFLLCIYGVVLVFIIIFSLGNKKKMKSRLKTYKSALNFLKYLIQLISFTLSIINAISTFFVTGVFDRISLLNAFVSLIITVIMVLFEVVKIMIRRNIPIVKSNLLKIKEKEDIERQQRYEQKLKYLEEKRNLKFIKKHKGLVNFEDFQDDSDTDNYNPQQKDEQIDRNNNDKQEYSYNQDLSESSYNENNEGFKQEKSDYTMKTGLMGFLSRNAHRNRVDNYDEVTGNRNAGNSSNIDDDFPVLRKNEEYDEHAGVIIDYDDGYDEDDYEDEEYYDDEILRDNNIKKGGKLSRFFKKNKKGK